VYNNTYKIGKFLNDDVRILIVMESNVGGVK
jgi:hypothetical protein